MAGLENVLCDSAVCVGDGDGTKHVSWCSDVVCQKEQIPPLKWKVNK